MLPEPNFRVRPDEFVGRIREIEIFCQFLQQGLVTGRTASFAILGDWGIGKSSLLLKLAATCSQPPFAMLPVFISVSTDIPDYLRLAEVLLSQFTDVLLTAPNMQARLRAKLRNWRFERVNFGGVTLERESPRLFLSSGSSLLRHMLTEAWDHFLRPAGLNGAIFFLDDLQNLTCICKYLMTTEKQIEAHKLETTWPAILDHLGREKFRSDVSKLSAKELQLIHQFASVGEGQVSADHFGGKFQREYFARLVEKGLL